MLDDLIDKATGVAYGFELGWDAYLAIPHQRDRAYHLRLRGRNAEMPASPRLLCQSRGSVSRAPVADASSGVTKAFVSSSVRSATRRSCHGIAAA